MDCIDLFKRAAMALQTDSRYLALDQARKMNDSDEELQNMIGEFNLARMDLNNEIGKSERNDARIAELMEKSLMLVTALAPKIGYDNAAKVAKSAHARGTTLKEEALRLGLVSADEFDRLVQPDKMTHPG